jgi:hypothetical protein
MLNLLLIFVFKGLIFRFQTVIKHTWPHFQDAVICCFILKVKSVEMSQSVVVSRSQCGTWSHTTDLSKVHETVHNWHSLAFCDAGASNQMAATNRTYKRHKDHNYLCNSLKFAEFRILKFSFHFEYSFCRQGRPHHPPASAQLRPRSWPISCLCSPTPACYDWRKALATCHSNPWTDGRTDG